MKKKIGYLLLSTSILAFLLTTGCGNTISNSGVDTQAEATQSETEEKSQNSEVSSEVVSNTETESESKETEKVVRDLSAWFTDYNGEEIQRIPSNDPLDINASVRTRGDVIYYKTDETDMQVVVKTMLDAMIKPLMEEEEGRTYKIIRYELEEQPIEQIEENVWLLKIVKGYYEYEGRDFITMEDALTYENNTKDGMVKFFAQGSDDAFQYLILKEGNVYRLEFEDNMDFEINR